MHKNSILHEFYSTSSLDNREVSLVICHVLNINTAGLYIFNKQLRPEQKKQIHELLKLRQDGMPLAYITGHKEFWTLSLSVNKFTLIPRPETEHLVEQVLHTVGKNFNGNILDLGTGSGAIALSLAKELPNAQITAVDISKECIEIVRANMIQNRISNVTPIHSSWFQNIKNTCFDVIVSNPPYIEEHDPHISQLKYEPITALVSGQNGLKDLKYIIENSPGYLNEKGYLFLEHGYNQYQDVQKLLFDNLFSDIQTFNDLAGIPRISMGRFTQ